MPRPQSPVWQHFAKEDQRAICNYCQHNMCGLVSRMRTHLTLKCQHCPARVRAEMSTIVVGTTRATAAAAPAFTIRAKQPRRQQQERELSPPRTQPQQVPTEIDDKTELDLFVARAILGLAQPVSAVENAAFVQLLKKMNPNYDPPSAYALAHSTLDLEYSETQKKLRSEATEASVVILGVESWAATHNRSLVSCIVNTPSPKVFSFESTGSRPHTPEVLVAKMEKALAQIGVDKVSVVMTDTSDNMRQAAVTLQDKYPTITFLPSCAHAMHAMMTEILAEPAIATVLDTCKQLARLFAYNTLARSALVRVSEHMQSRETATPLGNPDDESPSELLDDLFAVEHNRQVLEVLLADNNSLSPLSLDVKQQITSSSFWNEVTLYTGLLEPFLDVLKIFESDYPLLSTFYHRFTLLWRHIEKFGSLTPRCHGIMSAHWRDMRHPALYTAYLLDPRFPSPDLPPEATPEVLSYLKSLTDPNDYANLVSELTRFTGHTGLFADDAIWESAQKCSPLQWWKGFIGSSCPNLQAAALRTLCFPASCGLSRSKREIFEKVVAMNGKHMNEEQASKAAVVYLNTIMGSEGDGVANETIV